MTEDALLAEEPAQAEIETLPEAPKATKEMANKQANETADSEAELSDDAASDTASAVIAFADRIRQADTAQTPAAARANDLVTVRAKPEKRKNYKERAKAKFAKVEDDTKDGTTPDTTATAKSEVIEKAKAEKKAKAKVERQKAKEGRKAARLKAKKTKAAA